MSESASADDRAAGEPPRLQSVDVSVGRRSRCAWPQTAAEIDAAQALRYRVFYEEMGARPTPRWRARRRDFDEFDEVCDHLLVIDHAPRRAAPQASSAPIA